MKLYVGCALNYAPEEFRQRVEALKNILRKDYDVLEFVGLVKGTPRDVYVHDIHECVGECDAFVAICDYPSIGLGYELGAAIEKFRKPTLALAKEDVKVTRMLQGIEEPYYTFMRYNNDAEIPTLVKDFLEKLR